MNQLGAEGLIDSLSTHQYNDGGSTRTSWGNHGRSHDKVLADGSHWLVKVRRRKIKFETVSLLDLQHQLVAYLSQLIQEAAMLVRREMWTVMDFWVGVAILLIKT